jgi:hypothetical protein
VAALARSEVLQAKLSQELGDHDLAWQPLGHVLAVVTEGDHLGVVAAMVAAALTGNRLTLKARHHLGSLQALRDALGWTPEQCRIADWDSAGQDDGAWLAGVDGVVLAGSEALIRHYRQVVRPGVRLIEYGPRLSAALLCTWPEDTAEQARCVDALVRDTVLFAQGVCSSPQGVWVPDQAAARALHEALASRLDALPPLPEATRLAQWPEVQALALRHRLTGGAPVAWSAQTGWTSAILEPEDASPTWRGFRIRVGGWVALNRLPAMPQTLGLWPAAAARPAQARAFHSCAWGRMHERPLLAPHDGQWELTQWVHRLSHDASPSHLGEGAL